MQTIPDRSIDTIICDPPYGFTDCKWDSIIPLDALWKEYRRILKLKGNCVLFGNQPFTAQLIVSNLREYSHMWYWRKTAPTGHLHAKRQPLRIIEDVAVFILNRRGNTRATYNPQGLKDCYIEQCERGKSEIYSGVLPKTFIQTKTGYPRNVLEYRSVASGVNRLHPTQKPVALLEYLVNTYSNPGELVLDNCMGSGSTGVACANTGRRFIGIEKEKIYFDIASERIADAFSCSKSD